MLDILEQIVYFIKMISLDDKQVQEVIEEIDRTFDAEYGITWQTINDFVESKNMEQFKYRVLSPDGVYLEHDVYGYKTREEANEAIDKFVKNYEFQGYYSDKNRNRIPINEIKEHCKITEL